MRTDSRALRRISMLLWLGVLLAGCGGQLTPEARQLLSEARDAYRRDENSRTVTLADQFLQQHPGSVAADEALYLRGMAKYRLRDLDAATADFKEAAEESKKDSVRAVALTQLAEIAFVRGNMDQAEDYATDALIYTRPSESPADKAFYRLGCVLQRQGRWLEADEKFGKVTFWFADTELARLAARRLSARGWTVRAGTYQTRRYAEAAARKLHDHGLSVAVRAEVRDHQLVYLVEVGRFGNYAQAMRQLAAVKAHQDDAYLTVTR
ncbi:MAG: SPOR domain-containing protein [Phycisphaerae bacterium]